MHFGDRGQTRKLWPQPSIIMTSAKSLESKENTKVTTSYALCSHKKVTVTQLPRRNGVKEWTGASAWSYF